MMGNVAKNMGNVFKTDRYMVKILVETKGAGFSEK